MRSLLLIAVLACSGCSAFTTEAHVTSNTSWSGSFDGRTIDGSGNQTIKMGSGTGTKCATVQKQTRVGSLTVRIDGGEARTTVADFGVVSVCGGSGI